MIIAACKQTHVVNHGQARGKELDGAREQVVSRVAVQRAEVSAVVLVGGPNVASLIRVVEVFHIGRTAQAMLNNFLQLVHITHLHVYACAFVNEVR